MSKPLPAWLKPFWARLAVVLICLAWMVAETFGGQPFWATLALGAAAISAWELFIKPGRRREDQDG